MTIVTEIPIKIRIVRLPKKLGYLRKRGKFNVSLLRVSVRFDLVVSYGVCFRHFSYGHI